MTNKIPILMYHSIANKKKGTILRCIHIPPKRFIFQMKLLKKIGYTALSIQNLLPYIKGEKKGKVIGLTFDDGYANNLLYAAPILKKLGFTSTLYIVSELIGQHNKWDEVKNIAYNALMTKADIHSWINQGQDIGVHTKHHVALNTLSKQQQTQEIIGAKTTLETIFQRNLNDFCYPYGRYNQDTIEICQQAGFNNATTTERGRVTHTTDLFQLPRVFVPYHTLPHLFLLKILSNYEDNKNKQTHSGSATIN